MSPSAVAEARAIGASCGGVRIWSLYVPNGRKVDDPHYLYKLDWLARLREAASDWREAPVALVGDWNIAPQDDDVYDMAAFAKDTHVTPPERAAFQAFLDDGWTDVVRPHAPGPNVFTYWDYYRQRFERNRGMRIDFVLGSPSFAQRVTGALDRPRRARRDRRLRPRPGDRRPRRLTRVRARRRSLRGRALRGGRAGRDPPGGRRLVRSGSATSPTRRLSVVPSPILDMDLLTLFLTLALGLAVGAALGWLWMRGRPSYVDGRLESAEVLQGLDRLHDKMQDLAHQGVSWQSQLREQVLDVRHSTDLLRRETGALSTALRKPQVRGRWGELHLRRCVELAGLVDRCDFTEQARVDR